MARTVIDKTLPEFDKHEPPAARSHLLTCFSKIWGIARRPFSTRDIYKEH
jgi:hypothetical protein